MKRGRRLQNGSGKPATARFAQTFAHHISHPPACQTRRQSSRRPENLSHALLAFTAELTYTQNRNAMSLIAVFADVHNKTQTLARALAVLERRGVTAYWQLGDLGAEPLALLEGLPVSHVFGNWEVSGLPHLPADRRAWVANWPAHLTGPFWIASHATPVYPPGCTTTAATWRYMHEHHPRWLQVFPSLLHDERAIAAALAALAEGDRLVAFHGHTHVQAVQQLGPDGRLRRLDGPVIALTPGTRTLVGVGSIGVPRDGPHPRCVLFDPEARTVELLTLSL